MTAAECEPGRAEHKQDVAMGGRSLDPVHCDVAERRNGKLLRAQERPGDHDDGLHPVEDQDLEYIPSPPPHARERHEVRDEGEDAVEKHTMGRESEGWDAQPDLYARGRELVSGFGKCSLWPRCRYAVTSSCRYRRTTSSCGRSVSAGLPVVAGPPLGLFLRPFRLRGVPLLPRPPGDVVRRRLGAAARRLRHGWCRGDCRADYRHNRDHSRHERNPDRRHDSILLTGTPPLRREGYEGDRDGMQFPDPFPSLFARLSLRRSLDTGTAPTDELLLKCHAACPDGFI